MACATLPADIQGCINIPLIRGDYDIKMEARQGGCGFRAHSFPTFKGSGAPPSADHTI